LLWNLLTAKTIAIIHDTFKATVITVIPPLAGQRLLFVVTTHDTSTTLSPAFRAAEICLWSAETKMFGLTASAQAI
jgi:hypothetical protein